MYLNSTIIEATAAQYRKERMHEAAVERILRAARQEQQEQEFVARRLHGAQRQNAWQLIHNYVSTFLW